MTRATFLSLVLLAAAASAIAQTPKAMLGARDPVQLRLDMHVPRDALVRRRNEFACIFALAATESQPITFTLVERDLFVSIDPLEDFQAILSNR